MIDVEKLKAYLRLSEEKLLEHQRAALRAEGSILLCKAMLDELAKQAEEGKGE